MLWIQTEKGTIAAYKPLRGRSIAKSEGQVVERLDSHG